MVKELYKITTNEVSLNVSGSFINSIRTKNITKSGCRVYDGKYIGIAGTLGDETEETWKQAEENLELKVSYPYAPCGNQKRTRDLSVSCTEEEFLKNAEELLEILRTEFPEFIFSNKIAMTIITESLTNDIGLELINKDSIFNVSVLAKHVDSVNIFDTGVMRVMRSWDKEALLTEARKQLKAFNNVVELPKKDKILVSGDVSSFGMKLIEFLHGRQLGKAASPLSEKLGEKLFSPDFTLEVNRSDSEYLVPFFDSEGTTLANDRIALIENGVLKSGYTDKMNADEFGYVNTASASGSHDGVPSIGYEGLSIKSGEKNLSELVGDEEWVCLVMASGGDCTNEGNFATPVQLGYLMKGEEFIGRLPEFTVSGNIYEYFGEDYIGTSKDKLIFGDKSTIVRMKLN